MMLVKGYPFEMQGRLPRRSSCSRPPSRRRGCPDPHDLFWALFELGFAHYYAGDLDAAIAAAEESARVGGRRPARRCRPAAAARAGSSAWRSSRPARSSAARRSCSSSAATTCRTRSPSRSCFDWEVLALVELARGDAKPPTPTRGAPRSTPPRSACGCRRRSRCARGRPSLLAHGDAPRRRGWRAGVGRGSPRHRRAAARRVLARSPAARLPPRASATEAIAVLREAERELDACGSLRVRDELRRELRKLGARAEARGPGDRRRQRRRRADQARARDRRARHRPQDQPRDRRRRCS